MSRAQTVSSSPRRTVLAHHTEEERAGAEERFRAVQLGCPVSIHDRQNGQEGFKGDPDDTPGMLKARKVLKGFPMPCLTKWRSGGACKLHFSG